MSNKKGKLIVLDGTDGSGKSTQFKMLEERLRAKGINYTAIKFPVYDSPASILVQRYLAGEYGENADDVNIYAASMFYAMDRYDAWKKDYNRWRSVYEAGGIVIADRYTTANFIHQGGKLNTMSDRFKFFTWLENTEFGLFGLPEPDQVILLDMPASKAVAMLEKRREETGETADLHEKDAEFISRCHESAMDAAFAMDWKVIACASMGNLVVRSPEQIHKDVWKAVKEVIKRDK